MATPIVLVEYNQLLQVAQRFQTKAETVLTLRQQLQSMVSQLQHSWSGTAATSFFHEYQDEVEPAFERLRKALETARDVAIAIHTGMRNAEEAAAALFRANFDGGIDIAAAGLEAGFATLFNLSTAPPAPRLGAAKLPGGPVFDAAGNIIRFDLTLAEFEMLTVPERIQWVEALERKIDSPNSFHNIQDIIAFFDESSALGHMGPGTWASWADAGVLEAIQNGFFLFQNEGRPIPAGFNDCAGAAFAWKEFFVQQLSGLAEEKLIPYWAMAEQMGVNYGSDAANLRAGIPARGTAAGDLIPQFVAYGNLYRFIARNEGGGNVFVNRYSSRIGQDVGGTIAQEGTQFTTTIGDFIFNRSFGVDLPVKEILNAIWLPKVTPIGQEIGGEAADFVVPDEAGSWFFDPKNVIGIDMYTDSRTPPLSFPKLPPHMPLFPPSGKPTEPWNVVMTHGNTYYMSKLVEYELIPTLPHIKIDPSGEVQLDNGTIIEVNGDARLVDGTIIRANGTVTTATGRLIPAAGTRMNPDGSYTLSDGTSAK
ncbi:WXG100 family type VII secretion target [Herpetosiphon sp. NSE202]|uniref:WXG100 family type VII secretion target n=1 Tax=Herpetosiphon sp. NSE202 TaxID=3351349 RepID=UPI00362698EA